MPLQDLFIPPIDDLTSSRKPSSSRSIPSVFLQPGDAASRAKSSRSSPTRPKSRLSSVTAAPPPRDPDDSEEDFTLHEEVDHAARRKKRVHYGSKIMLGRIGRQQSSEGSGLVGSPRSTTPTPGGAPSETRRVSRLSESMLEDLVDSASPSTPPRTPVAGQPARAVPSIISGLVKRQASEATTSSISSSPVVDRTHERVGTISSISSLASLASSSSSISSMRSFPSAIPEDVAATPEDVENGHQAPDRTSKFLGASLLGVGGTLSSLLKKAGLGQMSEDAFKEPNEHVKFSESG